MTTGKRIRRGILFGSVGFLLSMLFLPLIVNFNSLGTGESQPLDPTQTAIMWTVIAIIGVAGFYLGYIGWGSRKDY